jgi:hypothetical protein
MSNGWQRREFGSGSSLDIGQFVKLDTTDQRDRGCGWVFHVSAEGINGGDTVTQHGAYDTEDDAKRAAADWIREFCATALTAIGTDQSGASGGASEIDRVQAAKRRALSIADERGKENSALRQALRTAIRHIEHMSAWIAEQKAGYSFESLGEDFPAIRDAAAKEGAK